MDLSTSLSAKESAASNGGGVGALSKRVGANASVRMLSLLVAFTLPAVMFLRDFYMNDPDFGWHLRAGEWILAHHSVPFTDPFSVYGAGKPWCDYSWLFDLFFAGVYRIFGLAGFALLEIVFRIAVPASLFRLARKLGLSFWPSVLTATVGAFSLTAIYAPRPGMFTIVFLILELQILFGALLKRDLSGLYWLIPLFWFWASIHIEFVYGLVVLAMFAAELILNFMLRYRAEPPPLPLRSLGIFAACILATLLTPYGWHLYSTVLVYAGQTHIYASIAEMLAMDFRRPYHYAVVFLALGAAGAMGWSRNCRPLYIVLFAFATVLGFRSIKDTWILAAVSVALFAVSLACPAGKQEPRVETKTRFALALCVIAVIAVGWRRYGITNSWIEMGLAGRYPEAAVRYIEKNHLTGPLYNDFSSGGFLIWRLPEIPVSMDGRTNVHGDERVRQYSNSLKGFAGWEKDADLAHANLIIWPAKSPLVGLLRCDPRFKEVFQDPQGVVFVRK